MVRETLMEATGCVCLVTPSGMVGTESMGSYRAG